MKPVNPRASNNPKGWRSVYVEYQKLTDLAQRLGEPVHKWSLQYPSTIKEKISGSWQVHYTLNGSIHSAYIGYDVPQSVLGLKHMYKTYPRHKRIQTPVNRPQPKPEAISDAVLVRRVVEEYQNGITGIRTDAEQKAFDNNYKFHKWLMSRRAGVLNMDMYNYVFNSGMYQYWPTPPLTQDSLNTRLRELEKIAKEKEARARRDRENL